MFAQHYHSNNTPFLEYYVPLNILDIKKDMYMISNFGEIYNIKFNRILSQAKSYSSGGYMCIGLQTEDNKRKIYYVHRLVALCFIKRTNDDLLNNRDIVNHKNFITDNNCTSNLEWTNYTENNFHAANCEYMKVNKLVEIDSTNNWKLPAYGESNGQSRLTNDQVISICNYIKEGISPKEILSRLNMEYNSNNLHLIYNIRLGRRWRSISENILNFS